jgi:uncharacterized protein
VKPADRRADSRTVIVDDVPAWLRQDADGVLIDIHLQPGARRNAVCGEHGGRLKIAIAAPPLEGRANDALIEWLAGRLGVPRRQVHLVAGQRSRDKTLRAEGASASHVRRRLAGE